MRCWTSCLAQPYAGARELVLEQYPALKALQRDKQTPRGAAAVPAGRGTGPSQRDGRSYVVCFAHSMPCRPDPTRWAVHGVAWRGDGEGGLGGGGGVVQLGDPAGVSFVTAFIVPIGQAGGGMRVYAWWVLCVC